VGRSGFAQENLVVPSPADTHPSQIFRFTNAMSVNITQSRHELPGPGRLAPHGHDRLAFWPKPPRGQVGRYEVAVMIADSVYATHVHIGRRRAGRAASPT